MLYNLKSQISESVKVNNSLINLNNEIEKIIKIIFKKIKTKGKLLICGNGGSAADSQHLVTEFVVRLRPHINRNPIPAISLVGDSSTITACGNDYNFNQIFKRNLQAVGSKKDILLVLSTSGKSKNVARIQEAQMFLGHFIFEKVEDLVLKNSKK